MYRAMHSSMKTGIFLLMYMSIFGIFGCSLQIPKPFSNTDQSPDLPVVKKTESRLEQEPSANPAVNEPATVNRVNTMQSTSNRAIHVEVNLPHNVEVGLPFDYVIEVTNLTDDKVKDVVVIDKLPDNLDVKSSVPKTTKLTAGIAKWFLGNLEPKEKRVIRVTGVPTGEGVLNFCTDIEYALPPVCLATEAVKSDLKITKSAPSEVLICDTIPITLVVTNPGTGIAHNVVVEEALPSGLITLDGRTAVEFKVGDLQAGESRTIKVDTKAVRTGTFKSIATATGAHGLRADSNTTTVVRQPVLDIKITGPRQVFAGLSITYDIVVSNVGDVPAESTVLDDIIPTNTTFVKASDDGSYDNGRVVWDMGALQPRESRKVRLILRSDSIGKGETLATAKASCAESVAVSATTKIKGIPAILLEVVDLEDPIHVGSIVTYVITVTNQGSATGTNIKVESILEDTMEYVSSTGATTGLVAGNKIIFKPLRTLTPKDKASWSIKVRAIKNGDVRFKVLMNSDQIGRDVTETEATHFYR